MGRGAWATGHGVAKELDITELACTQSISMIQNTWIQPIVVYVILQYLRQKKEIHIYVDLPSLNCLVHESTVF